MVKTITITDEAYNRIKMSKQPDESFSRLFLRQFEHKMTIKEFAERAQQFKISEKEADEWIDRIHKARKEELKREEKRHEHLRQLFSH